MAITTIDTFSLGIRINPKEALKGINSIKSKIENLKVKAPKVPAPKIAGGGFSSITNELKKSNFQADALDRRIKKVGISIQKTGRNIQGMGMKLQSIQMPAAIGFFGGTAFFAKAAQGATDLAESQDAVRDVFGDSSKGILDFGKNAVKAVQLTEREFLDLSIPLAAQLKNAGLEGEELNKRLIEIIARAADVGSQLNKDPKDVVDNFLSAFRGEGNPVEKYGIIINAAQLEQEALTAGISESVSKLSEQEKILLRTNSVMRQSEIAEGNLSRTRKSAANQQKDLAKEYQTTIDRVGNQVIPIKLKLINALGSLLSKFNNLSEANQGLVVKLGLGATALAGIAAIAAPAAIAFGGIIRVIGGAVFAFSKLRVLFGAIGASGALGGVATGFKVLRLAMIATPIGALLTAIPLLFSAFKKVSPELKVLANSVRNLFLTFKPLFSAIGAMAKPVIEALKPIVGFIGDVLLGSLRMVIKSITKIIESITGAINLGSKLGSSVKNVFSSDENEKVSKNHLDYMMNRAPVSVGDFLSPANASSTSSNKTTQQNTIYITSNGAESSVVASGVVDGLNQSYSELSEMP